MKPKIKKQSREHDRRCKLTTAQIDDIRMLIALGEFSYRELAVLFKGSKTTIFKWANDRNHDRVNYNCLAYYHKHIKPKKTKDVVIRLRKNLLQYRLRHRDRINEYHRQLGQYYRDIIYKSQ
jgi:hypothetical protein